MLLQIVFNKHFFILASLGSQLIRAYVEGYHLSINGCEIDMMVPHKIKDIDAFSCLYDKYAPALYGVILKLTPNVKIASNILEKSFIKIWEQLDCHNALKATPFILMLRITLQQCDREVGLPKNVLSLLLPRSCTTNVEINHSIAGHEAGNSTNLCDINFKGLTTG